ncbi:hypothetical protein JB92DRAFT_2833410 [Gautieria morchelliformis]|nr:hypothetical protein JB92DRAFT_2833410 [Gautieria morchelliformis]
MRTGVAASVLQRHGISIQRSLRRTLLVHRLFEHSATAYRRMSALTKRSPRVLPNVSSSRRCGNPAEAVGAKNTGTRDRLGMGRGRSQAMTRARDRTCICNCGDVPLPARGTHHRRHLWARGQTPPANASMLLETGVRTRGTRRRCTSMSGAFCPRNGCSAGMGITGVSIPGRASRMTGWQYTWAVPRQRRHPGARRDSVLKQSLHQEYPIHEARVLAACVAAVGNVTASRGDEACRPMVALVARPSHRSYVAVAGNARCMSYRRPAEWEFLTHPLFVEHAYPRLAQPASNGHV